MFFRKKGPAGAGFHQLWSDRISFYFLLLLGDLAE